MAIDTTETILVFLVPSQRIPIAKSFVMIEIYTSIHECPNLNKPKKVQKYFPQKDKLELILGYNIWILQVP